MKHNDMGERGAVLFKSGKPVSDSGPVREGTNNLSDIRSNAGGSPAPSHAKSRRGFGGRVPKVERAGEARFPARLSSLDSNWNNRNNQPARRPHYCGRWTLVRSEDGRRRILRLNCNTWACRKCGPKKAKRYKAAIRAEAERLNLCRFMTLTLDPSKIDGDPVKYLNACWAEMRVYLRRMLGWNKKLQFVRVLEFHKSGIPHLHILVSHFIPQKWLSEAWQRLGGGRIVDIKRVDLHRISRYLSKYLTKEMLMANGASRCRRVTTSRDIHLMEKKAPETGWRLDRNSLETWIKFFVRDLLESGVDDEGEVQFVIVREAAGG